MTLGRNFEITESRAVFHSLLFWLWNHSRAPEARSRDSDKQQLCAVVLQLVPGHADAALNC